MNPISVPSQPAKSNWFKASIAVAVTLGAALVFGGVHLNSTMNRTGQLESQIHDLRAAMKTEMVSLQQDASARTNEQAKMIDQLREDLAASGAKSTAAFRQASMTTKKYSEQLASKLIEQDKAAQERQQALSAQLGEMKETSTQTIAKVSGIETDVTNVRGEVAQTKSELDKTIGDLHSVRGDMGVQSGLIATNGKELAALKALGERAYYEFQLTKTKAPQRIGDVAVQLKKFDSKRNRFTIDLIADDKRVEKKDRTVNEPVQFYMAKARIPYELVVNEVRGDRIIGYIAAPKVTQAR